MAHYSLRVSREYSVLKSLVEHIAEKSSKVLIYQHDADDEISRTHIHVAIFGYTMSKPTLINKMTEYVPEWVGGNADYCCKKWDGKIKYITYMTKGNISPSYIKEYTSEELEEARSLWTEKLSTAGMEYAICFRDHLDMAQDVSKYSDIDFENMLGHVKRVARTYSYKSAGEVWTLQAAQKYKMLVSTWFFRANVPSRLKIFSDSQI